VVFPRFLKISFVIFLNKFFDFCKKVLQFWSLYVANTLEWYFSSGGFAADTARWCFVKTPTHPIHPMRPTRGHSCKYTSKSPLRLAGIRVNTQANRHSASLAFSHKHNLRLGALNGVFVGGRGLNAPPLFGWLRSGGWITAPLIGLFNFATRLGARLLEEKTEGKKSQ